MQEGARYGKSQPYDTTGIQDKVIEKATSFDLTEDDITVTCRDKNNDVTECWSCAKVQVEASASFTAIDCSRPSRTTPSRTGDPGVLDEVDEGQPELH